MPSIKSIRAVSVLGLLSVLSVACVYDPVYYGPPRHSAHFSYYEPWGYYYYPSARVYFHYSTGFYYYPSGSIWIRTRILPPIYRLDPRDRVHLHIENERPYLFHHQHVEKYRSRPQLRPTPQIDRQERDSHRNWYQEQQQYKQQKRYAPPPAQTRPTPRPRYEEEEERRQRQQPRSRYAPPSSHQTLPVVPEQDRDRARPGERSGQVPRQTRPSPDIRLKPQPQQEPKGRVPQQQKQPRYKKQYEEQYQEEYKEQQGSDKKRSKKDWREEERESRDR